MRLTHSRAVLAMVGVTLLWSTAGVVTRHLEHAASFEVTFWRSFFTLMALLVMLPLMRGPSVFAGLRHAPSTLWASGLCWSVMFTAFMLAMTLTTVAHVLVTMSIGPLLTALGASIFLRHRIALRTWVAIAVAGGAIAWIYGSQIGQAGGQVGPAGWLGIAVAFAVPVAGATNWTLNQRARARGEQVDLVPAVAVGALISCLVMLPLALPFQATPHDLGLLAFLGLFQLAIPCVGAVLCARVLSAPELSLLALLEVVFGILLAWVGAGEVPEARVLAGGLLVLAALVGNELLGWRQTR
jgi:drug/metabolite transporter (DMT)-like permease